MLSVDIYYLIASRNEQIVLLDEPALNMHITMQKVLFNEVQAASGNQYIVVTHSPALVPPEAIIKVSRFFMRQGDTLRVALDRSTLSKKEFSSLEKELRRSTSAGIKTLSGTKASGDPRLDAHHSC
jgi:predicted ATP-dependent endonuclease of OLD family